jgi:hypothetical protein
MTQLPLPEARDQHPAGCNINCGFQQLLRLAMLAS